MPRTIAVFFADSHLQRGAWASRPIHGDALFAFEQVVQYAVRRGVSAVFAAGDVLDEQRNRSAPITAIHGQIGVLADAGIRFYYIQGQHDFDDPPWLSGHAHATHLHGKVASVGDASVYGLDYRPAGRLQEALDAIPPGADVLLAHQTWGDWMGSVAAPQGDFAHVPVVSTLVTGDYHRAAHVRTHGKDGQELDVYSPGATCMQAIDEPAEHSFLVLRDDGTFATRPLRSRIVLDGGVLNRPEDLDAFVVGLEGMLADADDVARERLPEGLRVPLLRVAYSHRLADAPRRLEDAIRRRAHLFAKVLPPEDKLAPPRSRAAAADAEDAPVTPLTELPAAVDRDEEPEVFALVARLLTSQDRASELAAWRAEFMKESTQ